MINNWEGYVFIIHSVSF